jgi:hypothetical protein
MHHEANFAVTFAMKALVLQPSFSGIIPGNNWQRSRAFVGSSGPDFTFVESLRLFWHVGGLEFYQSRSAGMQTLESFQGLRVRQKVGHGRLVVVGFPGSGFGVHAVSGCGSPTGATPHDQVLAGRWSSGLGSCIFGRRALPPACRRGGQQTCSWCCAAAISGRAHRRRGWRDAGQINGSFGGLCTAQLGKLIFC